MDFFARCAAPVAALVVVFLSACGGSTSSDSSFNSDKAMGRAATQSGASYQDDVQDLYVAYFGRPADPVGLANFESALAAVDAPMDIQGLSQAYASNAAIQTLIDSFGTSQESQTLYGSGSTQDFVTAIFQNVLGRAPQSSGLTYWSNAIDSGALSRGDAALSIMAGALTNSTAQGQLDAQLIANRIAVASYFTAQVASQGAVSSYAGSAAAASARSLLSEIDTSTVVSTFQSTVATAVAALVQPGIYVLAGNSGYYDPNAVDAFSQLEGMVVDASGNLYAADKGNQVIWKITPTGTTVFAGALGTCGNADGTGSAASFCFPMSLTIDGAGNLYEVDLGYRAIRKITPDGVVTTLFTASTSNAASSMEYSEFEDITVDKAGNLYVTDLAVCVVWKITQTGVATNFAGTPGNCGATDGTGAAAQLAPIGITIDSADDLYVTQEGYANGVPIPATIRKISPQGVVTTISISGTVVPTSITVDGSGNLIFSDPWNMQVMELTMSGSLKLLADKSQLGGEYYPYALVGGLTSDASGNVYVADVANMAIREIAPSGAITTFAGQELTSGSTDGVGTAARFSFPEGIAVDANGNAYVADGNLTIRKITPDGTTSTLAGTPGVVGSTDGQGAAASFHSPYGITVDGSGNVFVTDSIASVVRKITPDGTVTTLAGNPLEIGTTDGTGSAALFSDPGGIVADSQGNLYVCDAFAIRKITPAGVITTFAGLSGVSGNVDGTGADARFGGVNAITIDSEGNLYVADNGNSTIRKITSAGVVSTVTTVANAIPSGGGSVTIQGIVIDSSGNFYVTDSYNQILTEISSAGVATVVAGVPTYGYGGGTTVPGPLPGNFSIVQCLAIGPTGMLYMTAEDAVLKIKPN